MRERIISGVILAVGLVGLGFFGSYPLTMILMACSVIGYLELTAVVCSRGKQAGTAKTGKNRKDSRPASGSRLPDLIAIPGMVLSIVYYAGQMYIEWRYGRIDLPGMTAAADFWTLLILALDILLTMGVYVYTFPRRKSSQATGAIFSFAYVPVLMSYICRTRLLPHGFFLYLMIFVCSSVSDVCALAAGMAVGRHKLAPVLSPKKTIEGAIGGVIGSAAVSCLLALVLRRFDPAADVMVLFLIIGIFGSIISQTGDLGASAIKRNHGIKDYGKLIPGHGGIMDRFDSVLFTAPVIYYLACILLNRF